MKLMDKLSPLKQHVEDNVRACVVNHALFDEIIHTVRGLQQLNRCNNETCLWTGEGSEHSRVISCLGKHRELALRCRTSSALHTFEEQFQIV